MRTPGSIGLRGYAESFRRLTRLAAVALAALAFVFAVERRSTADTLPQSGKCASSLDYVDNSYGDFNINYDFVNSLNTGSCNVDWADALLFFNNASAVKVGGAIGWNIPGGAMWGYQGEAELPERWAQSRGVKENFTACVFGLLGGYGRHVRLYGGDRGYMFNPLFGYYVWGTTHYDYKENCGGWSGDSETAENSLVGLFAGKGYGIAYDWGWLNNVEVARWEGTDHYWNNDGYATYVNIG